MQLIICAEVILLHFLNFFQLLTNIVGHYVRGTSMPDVSASTVLHTHSPAKRIARIGSPILDQMTLVKPRKKDSFANILRI